MTNASDTRQLRYLEFDKLPFEQIKREPDSLRRGDFSLGRRGIMKNTGNSYKVGVGN